MRPILLAALLACPARAGDASYEGYLAGPKDLEAVGEGIALALKAAPEIFPRGVDNIDVVIYDSAYLYVFSRADYELPRHGAWKDYRIYRVAHGETIDEDALDYCGSTPGFVYDRLYNAVPYNYFTCTPLTPFLGISKRNKSFYQRREAYLTTFIHEYAHAYLSRELWQVPEALPILERVKALPTRSSREQVAQEAYAIWAELKAGERLIPGYRDKLLEEYSQDPDDNVHRMGFRIALDVLKSSPSQAAAKTR